MYVPNNCFCYTIQKSLHALCVTVEVSAVAAAQQPRLAELEAARRTLVANIHIHLQAASSGQPRLQRRWLVFVEQIFTVCKVKQSH